MRSGHVGRCVRSAVAAVTTVVLAAAAHAAGHGALPPVVVLVPVAVAVAAVGYAVASRRVSRWTILGLLGAAQLVIHLLGGYVDGPHAHDATSLMVGTHIAATAATALLLASAERVWWHVRAFAERRHDPVVRPPAAPAAVTSQPRRYEFVVLLSPVVGDVGVRGPPRPLRLSTAA